MSLHIAAEAPPRPDLASSRLDRLRAVERLLTADPQRVLRVLTEVTTYRAAEYELAAARATLAGAGAELARHRPARLERLAAYLPSNVLLYSYVLYLLVPSLFVDRLSFRPASAVRGPMRRLHEVLAPVHRLPIEQHLVSQRAFLRDQAAPADVVVFTGSYQNAEQLRPQLRPEQLFLYLGGGANPFVVAPGGPLAQAARDAVTIRLLNSGQDCLAPDIFLVHDSDLPRFVALLTERLTGLRYGPPADPTADYGPIVYRGALEQAASHLFHHRDQIVHGGRIDVRHGRIDPTVLVVDDPHRFARTEVFAPIFNLAGYADLSTLATTLTTGTFAERALGASVYGHAPDLVASLASRHVVTVNETLLAIDEGNAPFGGRGPMANYVAIGGRLFPEPILVSKAVADHLRPTLGGVR